MGVCLFLHYGLGLLSYCLPLFLYWDFVMRLSRITGRVFCDVGDHYFGFCSISTYNSMVSLGFLGRANYFWIICRSNLCCDGSQAVWRKQSGDDYRSGGYNCLWVFLLSFWADLGALPRRFSWGIAYCS